MDDNSVAGLAILCIFAFGVPVLGWIFVRWLAHRERMAMIHSGIAPGAVGRPREAASGPQRRGRSDVDYDTAEGAQRALRKGIRLACIGLALFIGLSFIGFDDGIWHPGPWLLGGLIPMFVGIAQILSALASGATLGPRIYVPGSYTPPPAGATPPNSPPPTYDGSYTYRPDGTQELRPPTAPPERK